MTDPDTYAAKLAALTSSLSSADQVLAQAEVLYEAYLSEPSAVSKAAKTEALLWKFEAKADDTEKAKAIIAWLQHKL